MTIVQIIWALITVVAISTGQILFKQAGIEIQIVQSWFTWKVLVILTAAFLIYGAATLLWINLLRTVPLNKAYLFTALSFIIVPIAGQLLFREQITIGSMVGSLLVIGGILVSICY